MCRIFGQFGPIPVNESALKDAAFVMRHGGPDRQSYKSGKGWAIGNNRLSIQGIEGGDQPFSNAEGLCAVFNGEIYNYNELRVKLRQHGFSFSRREPGARAGAGSSRTNVCRPPRPAHTVRRWKAPFVGGGAPAGGKSSQPAPCVSRAVLLRL